MTGTFRVGPLVVARYVAMLYVGCVAGTLAGAAAARSYGLDETRFALATIALLVPAIVGSRLWFLIQNPGAEGRRLWSRREGGSALYGGLVLSFALSPAVLEVAGVAFWRFWDAATFTMLVGLVFTRIGCTLQGCCAGRATRGPFGIVLPDARGRRERRIPTPLLEAAWGVAALAVAVAVRSRIDAPGVLFAAVLGGYAAVRIVLEPTREASRDPRILRSNLRFSGALLGLAAAFLIAGPT